MKSDSEKVMIQWPPSFSERRAVGSFIVPVYPVAWKPAVQCTYLTLSYEVNMSGITAAVQSSNIDQPGSGLCCEMPCKCARMPNSEYVRVHQSSCFWFCEVSFWPKTMD